MFADDVGHVTASQPIRVPQFHGDSYIVVPLRRPASKSLSFEIWFLTYEPNGMYKYQLSPNDRAAQGLFITRTLSVAALPVCSAVSRTRPARATNSPWSLSLLMYRDLLRESESTGNLTRDQ